MRYTTDLFIKKANIKHNNKYLYDKTIFTHIKNKLIIICKIHGYFEQVADCHINGRGCQQCSKNMKYNNSTFIQKSNEIHNNLYDYSNINYINIKTRVNISCKLHGLFIILPNNHIKGYGCPKCSKHIHKYTQESFLQKCKETHGDLYNYSKVIYTNILNKIIIICKDHGNFIQTASNHINQKNGCPKCKATWRLSNTDKFIEKAKEIHGELYDYSKVEYKKASENIIIICKVHKDFLQAPNTHLNGNGCRKCGILLRANNQRRSDAKYIKLANICHNNLYTYENINYTNTDSFINITCKSHGKFERLAKTHLKGAGCPQCNINNKFSKVSIEWLKFVEIFYNINIQHMGNSNKEYKIKNTNWHADGYCKDNNTIYEFHGSFFHGDPLMFSKNEYNSICKRKMGTLYDNTIARENKIKNLGYNLIIMWESKWNIINKSMKKLQRQFRQKKTEITS